MLKTAYTGNAAGTYDAVRFTTPQGLAFDQLEREQLMKAVNMVPPGSAVLEVGCGTARFAIHLATLGYHVTASDPSPDMLRIAQEKAAGRHNIQFKLAEGVDTNTPSEQFDLTYAIRVMNSLESAQYALATAIEMIRVTKPGGLVLIEFANAERPLARRNNSVRLSFAQLRRLATENGCSVVHEAGVLVLSQTVLNVMPAVAVPAWVRFERALASALWPLSSRGYLTLRKNHSA